MKIVLVDKEEIFRVGGIIVYNTRFSAYLKKQGHQVTVLRFGKTKSKKSGFTTLPYYLSEPRSYIFLPTEKTLSIIESHLKKIKPDIVYTVAGLSPLDFFLPSLCHRLGIPISAVWHADIDPNPGPYQLLVKSIFLAFVPFCRQLDLLHVFSDKLKDFYVKHGVPAKKIIILPNGVDSVRYSPGPSLFQKKYGFAKGILFLGRLTLQKNPEVLIKSFLSVNPPLTTRLVMVGYGDKKRDLQETYRDKRIIFTGAITNEKRKLDIIRSCRIFVLPSRFEGMSLAILEAMSCGLACITSDVGSNKELLQGAGLIIPFTRLNQELPSAIRILLDNPDFVKTLGEKARQKVITNHSQDKIFAQLTRALISTAQNYQPTSKTSLKDVTFDKVLIGKIRPAFRKLKQLSSYLTLD